jgi:hypothetical protein
VERCCRAGIRTGRQKYSGDCHPMAGRGDMDGRIPRVNPVHNSWFVPVRFTEAALGQASVALEELLRVGAIIVEDRRDQ